MSKEITSKTKRIADILSLLEQAPVQVPELAARFGVSKRTIQRDMELLVQAQFPVISPRQSVYMLAPGFSLAAAKLSAAQASLLVMAADVSRQIGGDFAPVPETIGQRFMPASFAHCVFGATKYDFAETEEPAITLLKCIKYHCLVRVYLKDCKKNRTLYPYILLRLYDKWYVVSANSKREMACYALENIGNFSLREDRDTTTGYAQFRPVPFIKWAIWQRAHRWVEERTPQPVALPAASAQTPTVSTQGPTGQAQDPTAAAQEPTPQAQKAAKLENNPNTLAA